MSLIINAKGGKGEKKEGRGMIPFKEWTFNLQAVRGLELVIYERKNGEDLCLE